MTSTTDLAQVPALIEQVLVDISEHRKHPYGPEVTPDMVPSTGDALTRLCGDVESARKAYAAICSDLGGYMPRGVVLALLRVAKVSAEARG